MKCPKCGSKAILKYTTADDGIHAKCTNTDCNYEVISFEGDDFKEFYA